MKAPKRTISLFFVLLVGGVCTACSPAPSWVINDRLVDHFVAAARGDGRDLPVATIGDDTRYVLRRPHSEPIVLWKYIEGHKEAAVIQRESRLPKGLADQSELVIFPSVTFKGGEWFVLEPRVAVVGKGSPPVVSIDFEISENPSGRRIELYADGFAADTTDLERIEVPPVTIAPASELRFSMGLVKPELQSTPSRFSVQACVASDCTAIFDEVFDPTDLSEPGWRDRRVDLDGWAGMDVSFRFEAEGESGSPFPAWPVWANPTVYRSVPPDLARKNVILLSIDTLRADHLSSYGYRYPTSPFIDERFAQGGSVFDHPVAAAATTSPAHASIFTAVDVATHQTYDGFHALPALPTLPELVRAAGFDTVSYNENGWLSARIGFSRGFDRFVENRSDNINSPSGQVDKTFDAAAKWIRENRDTPFFLFLHTYQVHTPYAPPEKYKDLFGPSAISFPGAVVPDELLSMAEYDREIRYTDDELRRLFETFDELDLGRDTVVILTSDHGEAFLEHGVMEHGTRLDDTVLRVPLMMWGAGIPQGRRVATPVGQIDYLPTVLDLLGVSLPAEIQGRSIMPLLAAVDEKGKGAFHARRIFSQARAPYAMVTGGRSVQAETPGLSVREKNMKLSRYTTKDGQHVYEYYDVVADPEEKNDLSAVRKDEVEVLRQALDRHELERELFRQAAETLGTPGENKAGPLSPDQESKLRALGYIE